MFKQLNPILLLIVAVFFGCRKKEQPSVMAKNYHAPQKIKTSKFSDDACEKYSDSYNRSLGLSEGLQLQGKGLNLTSDKMKSIAYKLCKNIRNASPSHTSADQAVEIKSDSTSDFTFKGELNIVEAKKVSKKNHDKSGVIDSALETAFEPIFSATIPGFGLYHHEESLKLAPPLLKIYNGVEEVPQGFHLAEQNFVDRIMDILLYGIHGLGTGISVSGSAGFGARVGASFGLEMVYHNNNGENIGEIGVFCAPGVSLGAGSGASIGVNLNFIKTLGCTDSGSYEGGFLSFPFSVGGISASFAIGVDAPKFIQFVEAMVEANWQAITNPEKLANELKLLDREFVNNIAKSKDSFELISFYFYLVFLNAVVGMGGLNNIFAGMSTENINYFSENLQRNTIDQIIPNSDGTGAKIPKLLHAVISNLANLDFLTRDFWAYPSLNRVFKKVQALLPAETFPVSHFMLEKLIAALAGCDGITFSYSPSPTSVSKGFSIYEVSYSYYVNPPFLTTGDPQKNRSKKMILHLGSFKDFIDPDKWLKAGETFANNIVVKPVEIVADAVDDLFLVDPNNPQLGLAGLGDDIVAVTGLNNFGPIEFIGKVSNLINPKYVYDHCLKATGNHLKDAGKAIGKLFGNGKTD